MAVEHIGYDRGLAMLQSIAWTGIPALGGLFFPTEASPVTYNGCK